MNQLSFEEFFKEEMEDNRVGPPLSYLETEIKNLLDGELISSLYISEQLMATGMISKERYSTGKPKEYGTICSILESYVNQGVLVFIEDKDRKDRIYRFLNKETGDI